MGACCWDGCKGSGTAPRPPRLVCPIFRDAQDPSLQVPGHTHIILCLNQSPLCAHGRSLFLTEILLNYKPQTGRSHYTSGQKEWVKVQLEASWASFPVLLSTEVHSAHTGCWGCSGDKQVPALWHWPAYVAKQNM